MEEIKHVFLNLVTIRAQPISLLPILGKILDKYFSQHHCKPHVKYPTVWQCSVGEKQLELPYWQPNFEFSYRSIENTVVFRADIAYTAFWEDPYTADGLVALVSPWAQSGTSINIDSTRLDVGPSCPTQLESFEAGHYESETVSSEPTASGVNVAALGGAFGAACLCTTDTSYYCSHCGYSATMNKKTEEIQVWNFSNYHIHCSFKYLYLTVSESPILYFCHFFPDTLQSQEY